MIDDLVTVEIERGASIVDAVSGQGAVDLGSARRLQCWEATDADLEALVTLASVEALRLLHANITDSGLAHLLRLPRLRVLEIGSAGVTDEGLATLGRLGNLVWLELDRARIGDAGLVALRPLQLRRLNLVRTRVRGTGLAALHPGIRELGFIQGGIDDPGMAGLLGFRDLQHLDLLDNNNVTDQGAAHLAQLTSLRGLHLGLTGIRDPGIEHLARLPHLLSLDLMDLWVTDASVPSLSRISTLRDLYLHGTSISPTGAEALRSALPDCRIHI